MFDSFLKYINFAKAKFLMNSSSTDTLHYKFHKNRIKVIHERIYLLIIRIWQRTTK